MGVCQYQPDRRVDNFWVAVIRTIFTFVHVSVFQRESADKYSAQGGTTSPTCSAGEKLASPPTRTLPEHFSLCDSERIKVLSLNCMDDLSSDSKVVHRALCRNWNGATVKTNTATIVAFIRG